MGGGACVADVEVADERPPVSGVGEAVELKAVGPPEGARGVGALGVAERVAAVVLLGVEQADVAVVEEVDAVGGARHEARVGVGGAERLVGGCGVLAVGFDEGEAVAAADSLREPVGVWAAVDKVLNIVERADGAGLLVFEGVAAEDHPLAYLGGGEEVGVEEGVVGVDSAGGMGVGLGL